MKCVILAGGLGTRLMEETDSKPKPMVVVGNKPILWHIMKMYSFYGIHDFIICLGYKGHQIKDFFLNYYERTSDITINLEINSVEIHKNQVEPWRITLIDTGLETMTGGRLKKVAPFLDEEDFCLTYGDGLSDVNISALVNHHKKSNCLATVTSVQPPGRYGVFNFQHNRIISFREKPENETTWINGGFFVLSSHVIDYIQDDTTIWEKEPMEMLAKESELNVYFHNGFWQCMDTLRDKHLLNNLWDSGKAAWKVWENEKTSAEAMCR